jgi:hypothetical protein
MMSVAAELARPVAPEPVTPDQASAPDPASGDLAAGASPEPATEAGLRHALVTAADPAQAALDLAGWLAAGERHDEALHVLEQALARAALPALQVARYGVLRDLGRRAEAAAVLAALAAAAPAPDWSPQLWFEAAELAWLEGDAALARARLAALSEQAAGSAFCREHAGRVAQLQRELASGRPPSRVPARDLLGNLRGAPEPAQRVAALRALVGLAGSPEPRSEELAALAVAIAAADPSPAVRATAVRLAQPEAAFAVDFCAAALADPAPHVRLAAVERTVHWLGTASPQLLLPALQQEADAMVFAALDAALVEVTAHGRAHDSLAVGNPAARAAVLDAWRQFLAAAR